MLADDTMLCGCTGVQEPGTGRWFCPVGHEFIEAVMACEITDRQAEVFMRKAKAERAIWTLDARMRSQGVVPWVEL